MKILTAGGSCLMFGVFILSGMQAVHAQTAEDILNKTDALYANAKTYQSTYHIDDNWKDLNPKNDPYLFSCSEMVEVKAMGLTKYALHFTFDKPTKQHPNTGLTGTSDMVDDGINHYLYYSSSNDYTRSSHSDYTFIKNYIIIPQLKPQKGFTYTLLAPEVVAGKAAFVIEGKGAMKQLIPGLCKYDPITKINYFTKSETVIEKVDDLFYIDKANFHLLQIKSKRSWPDFTVNKTVIIKSEILDAPLPDSTFVFVAPKGVEKR